MAEESNPDVTGEATTAAPVADTVQSPLTDTATDKPITAPPTWPENWRALAAGEDEGTAKLLGRYADPAAVAKALREAQTTISRRLEPMKAPAADAKPEDVAAYRKAAGVPDDPADYLKALPEGVIVADADKPLVEVFAKEMHAHHAPPGLVGAALKSYYAIQEQQAADRLARDGEVKNATEDALRQEWGADYRPNLNAIGGFLDTAPREVKDAFLSARMTDGTPIASNKHVLQWMLGRALESNPAITVLPGSGANAGKGIDERIGEIEGAMRDPKSGYWKNEKMQAEYRQLLEARERMAARA